MDDMGPQHVPRGALDDEGRDEAAAATRPGNGHAGTAKSNGVDTSECNIAQPRRGATNGGVVTVTFEVPFTAAKQRPRVPRNGHAYTPDRTSRAERAVASAFIRECIETHGGPLMAPPHAPVSVAMETLRPLPASRPKAVGSEPDTYKPDLDNYAKLALDALNGIAWADDAQVTDLRVTKLPRERGAEERTAITVSWEAEAGREDER